MAQEVFGFWTTDANRVWVGNYLEEISQTPLSLLDRFTKKKEAVKEMEDAIIKANKFLKDNYIDL